MGETKKEQFYSLPVERRRQLAIGDGLRVESGKMEEHLVLERGKWGDRERGRKRGSTKLFTR